MKARNSILKSKELRAALETGISGTSQRDRGNCIKGVSGSGRAAVLSLLCFILISGSSVLT